MNQAEKVVSTVNGFIEPIFTGRAPNGQTLQGISPEDARRIQQGYACGECLATFNTFTLVCPVCQRPTNVLDVPPPQEWLDHLHERENGPVEHNQPRSFDEMMARRALEADEFKPFEKKPRTRH